MLLSLFYCLLAIAYSIETIEVRLKSLEPISPTLNLWEGHDDFFNRSVNLNIASGANRSRFFQIRGIGDHSQYDNFNQSSVSLFYKGIDLSEEPQALLISENQIRNVQYTSQTIEIGGKGMGGALYVESCPPSLCSEKSLSLVAQSYDTQIVQAFLPFELSPAWSLAVKVRKLQSDGFQYNEHLDRATGDQNELSLELDQYLKLQLWEWSLQSLLTKTQNGYDHFSHDNSRTTQSDRPGRENLLVHGHSLRAKRRINDWVLSSLTSLTSTRYEQSFDEDWGNDPYWNDLAGWGQDYDYSSFNRSQRLKLHQRLELQSDVVNLALHYYQSHEQIFNDRYRDGNSRGQTRGENQLKSLALLGGYRLIDYQNHKWTPEFRMEGQRQSLQAPIAQRKDNLLWAARSRYQIALGTKSRGEFIIGRSFRGGGYNLETEATGDRRFFKPESLKFAEMKVATSYIGGIQNLSLFYHKRANQQLRTSFQDDPLDPSSFTTITQNLGSSDAFGLELSHEMSFGHLSSSIHIGLLKSEFKRYSFENRELQGRETPYAPSYSFRLDNQLRLSEPWQLILSIYGKDGFYFSNSHDLMSQSYELVDFTMSFELGSWQMRVYGKNLFDKNYSQRGFYFSNEPPEWEEKLYTQPAPPLTYGMSITYQF